LKTRTFTLEKRVNTIKFRKFKLSSVVEISLCRMKRSISLLCIFILKL